MPDNYPSSVSPTAQIASKNKSFYTDNLAKSKQNLNHKAFVIATDQQILVEAWLPETIGTDVSATYEAPYAQGLSGKLPGDIGTMARFMGLSLTTQAMTIQVWQGGSFIEFVLPFIFQAETSAATDVMRPIKDLLKLTMPVDASNGGFLTAPGPVIDPGSLAANGIQAAFDVAKGTGDTLNKLSSAVTGLVTQSGSSAKINNAVTNLQSAADGIARPFNDAILKSIKNNISLHIGQFLYFPSVIIKDVSPTFDVQIGPDLNPIRATVNVTFQTFYIPTSTDIESMFVNATISQTGDAFQSTNPYGVGN